MAAESDDGRDAGFTLMEVIVVVLLVGVLASVMVAVVAVILRNAPSTEAQRRRLALLPAFGDVAAA